MTFFTKVFIFLFFTFISQLAVFSSELEIPVHFNNFQEFFTYLEYGKDARHIDPDRVFKLAVDSSLEYHYGKDQKTMMAVITENYYDFLKIGKWGEMPGNELRGASGNGRFDVILFKEKGFDLVGVLFGNGFTWSSINGKEVIVTTSHISAAEYTKTVYGWDSHLFQEISHEDVKQPVEVAPDDVFPLRKGDYWVYRGKITTGQSQGKMLKKHMTWKMEVKDVLVKNHIKVAFIKGHPADLAFYEQGRQRGDYLIVDVNDKKYYLLTQSRQVQNFLQKFSQDPLMAISSLDDQWDIFLAWPLEVGGFCMNGDFRNPATWLGRCHVDGKEDTVLSGIKGITTMRTVSYQLRQRDNTGHDIIDFVPGVGITRYIYSHHGSVSEVDMRLVEFHQGSGL